MVQGETLYSNGYQVMLFPLDYLNCTQVPSMSSYSHCCGEATDWVGTSPSYPIYAPCDCTYSSGSTQGGTDNFKSFTSDNPVLTPSGIKTITFSFCHDNDITYNMHYNQGELIGHTGIRGNVTGDHVHLDQAVGNLFTLYSSGITCSGGVTCYMPYNGIDVTDTYFLSGSETIVNLMNLDFETYSGGRRSRKGIELFMMLSKRKFMKKRGLPWR